MYKLSITTLKALKAALVNSNEVLTELRETNDSPWIYSAIKKNEEQIRILTEQYYINETTN
jgi:hypothetical protein